MFLSDLKENQRAEIICVNCGKAFSTRLSDMGFCKGERVVCVRKSVFSSPILFHIKGADIALRKSDAQKIGVIL